MLSKEGTPGEPEEHYVETGRHRSWPAVKIVSLLLIVALVFGAGVAVGKGDAKFWEKKTAVAGGSLDYSSVNAVLDNLKANYDGQLDQTKLIQGLKAGLVEAAGDPYTVYFNPADAKAFNNELAGTITGIGAELGSDSQKNTVIISPLSGYPAEKAGLKPKDKIVAVNGKTTQGMSVDAVVHNIRGKEGTKVTLTVVRGDGSPYDLTITRQKISVPSVKWQVDGNIGYLKINQFSSDTVGLAQKAAQEFKDKKVKGVVLDLRGDPGGYLNAAVDVSSLWLDSGKTVVQEKRGSTVVDTDYATGNNPLKGLPTIVLIDGGSASASEITAGALKDNGVAKLVGAKSFGKGSVQQVIKLSDGSELKVTVARWYRPNGKNIDKQGITPDIAVSSDGADLTTGNDPQKAKAYELLQAQL